MKRRKRRLFRIGIALIVMAAIFIFKAAFNGRLMYFTFGFDKHTLLEVGDQSLYDYEAEIMFSDIRSQYEELFGNDVWSREINGQSFEDYAKEQVRTKLIRVAYMNELAKDRGVVLNRDETANVTKAAKEYMDGLSQEQKGSDMITQENVEGLYTKFAIANRLYADMTGNIKTEVSADYARVIRIQYVCADTQESINKAKARLDSGENFFYVARDINEGGDYECELKRGEMEKEFEDAAYNLATGETSGIVNAAGKYYIIKCISDNEKTKTEANKNAIIEAKKLEEFNSVFEQFETSVYMHFNDRLWNEIRFDALKSEVSFEDVFNKYFK